MGQDSNKERNTEQKKEEYIFINETIKKRPTEKRKLCRIAAFAGCGMVLGGCAMAAWGGIIPSFARREGEQEKIVLTMSPSERETETTSEEQTAQSTDTQQKKSPLEIYEDTYKEVLKVAQQPQKALVTVTGITDNENILDNSYVSGEDSEGIIFLETDTFLYILTYEDELEDLQKLQITFTNGAMVNGELCMGDEETGLAVATVKKSELSEEILQDIYVANLEAEEGLEQSDMVIVIGAPAGDDDAVIYGMITSTSGKLQTSDNEYSVLATDIYGSTNGNGVLLDCDGNVAGIIMKEDKTDSRMIHALEVSQILPLVERLSNGEKEKYTGIYGISIGQAKCRQLGIENGLYVDSIAAHSPAMTAGVQNGDIISKVDGQVMEDMQSYHTYLQTKKAGEKITLTILRKDTSGKYAEMDFKVKIEER